MTSPDGRAAPPASHPQPAPPAEPASPTDAAPPADAAPPPSDAPLFEPPKMEAITLGDTPQDVTALDSPDR
jgi:hypothetical protein